MGNAPILISVYNRPSHLKMCVESVLANYLSGDSDLFVVSDGAASAQDQQSVAEVRNYIKSIQGFRSVTGIIREKNLGAHVSVTGAMEDLLDRFGKLIVVEDDNVVSLNFLQYVNGALDFYQTDPTIFAISGYNYPVRIPKSYPHDIYKSHHFSTWGVGLWNDRWRAIRWSLPAIESIAPGTKRRRELDNIGEHLCAQMIYDIKHNKNTADAIINYHQYVHDMYSIFPVVSKVRNHGHDGTGEHGGHSDAYSSQSIDANAECRFIKDLDVDPAISEELRKHFAIPFKTKCFRAVVQTLPGPIKDFLKRHREKIGNPF